MEAQSSQSFLKAYAYLGALSVTAGIVTLPIQAATSLDDTGSLTPLAVLCVLQPVQAAQQYALQAQYP